MDLQVVHPSCFHLHSGFNVATYPDEACFLHHSLVNSFQSVSSTPLLLHNCSTSWILHLLLGHICCCLAAACSSDLHSSF